MTPTIREHLRLAVVTAETPLDHVRNAIQLLYLIRSRADELKLLPPDPVTVELLNACEARLWQAVWSLCLNVERVTVAPAAIDPNPNGDLPTMTTFTPGDRVVALQTVQKLTCGRRYVVRDVLRHGFGVVTYVVRDLDRVDTEHADIHVANGHLLLKAVPAAIDPKQKGAVT